MWIDTEGPVVYEHYMKSVSSKYLIHARSAVPEKMKRTVNTQEALRILLNCSKRLPRDIVLKHLQHFAARMQYSGYSVKIRRQVIESAVSAYNKIERDERDGVRPMYRKREWRWEEREVEKREKTVGWYRKGGQQSVLFVPATPDSSLLRLYRREINRSMFKIRVVERRGLPLKQKLQKSNPFGRAPCCREDCLLCKSDGKGSCDRNGVVYSIKCECGDEYIGQTARNAYMRGKEHLQAYNNGAESSVMWSHCVDHHSAEEQIFTMDVVGQYGNDAMKRQIAEAVKIKRSEKATMNNKREWRHIEVPRAVIQT